MEDWKEQRDAWHKQLERLEAEYNVALPKLDKEALDRIHEERVQILRAYDRAYVLADLQAKGDVEALKRGW